VCGNKVGIIKQNKAVQIMSQ